MRLVVQPEKTYAVYELESQGLIKILDEAIEKRKVKLGKREEEFIYHVFYVKPLIRRIEFGGGYDEVENIEGM